MIHLHLGAGNFGLGFVVPIFFHAGLSPVVFNRRPAPGREWRASQLDCLKKRRSYTVTYNDYQIKEEVENIKGAEYIEISDFYYYDSEEDLGILDSIIKEEDSGIVITTSLKDKDSFSYIAEFVSCCLQRRERSARIYLVACENGFLSTELGEYIRSIYGKIPRLVFVDAAVDRVCRSTELVPGRSGEKLLNISTEKYRKLVLRKTKNAEKFYKIFHNMEYVKITENFHIHLAFKLNVINAAHIFLAGDAQYYGMPLLNFYLSEEDVGANNADKDTLVPNVHQRRVHLSRIFEELATGMKHILLKECENNIGAIEEMEALLAQVSLYSIQERFTNAHDDSNRVLSRLKTPTKMEMFTMSDFLRSMMPKIKPPVVGYLESKRVGPPAITESFLRIAELIADRRFVDSELYTH